VGGMRRRDSGPLMGQRIVTGDDTRQRPHCLNTMVRGPRGAVRISGEVMRGMRSRGSADKRAT